MTSRTEWHELPRPVRAAVEERTGPVTTARALTGGLNCAVAAALTAADGTVTFVKGTPVTNSTARTGQRWEVVVNPYTLAVGPRLLWRVTVGGWEVLGFEYVEGARHADLSVGAGDLRLVAEALGDAHGLRPPPPHLGVPSFAGRWAAFLETGELPLLHGRTLLHTDTHPHNLLVTADRAHLVDWAMPALGPAWVDVANTAVRLMEADCPPHDALAWAAGFTACWRTASPAALRAFVAANCRAWTSRVGAIDARPSNDRFAALLGLL
ncbi:phosphotransferase family protein [Streptomyces sp. UNOB3_S3]|uniref:phosphotransferase family protein n=1 Tax=Streptomyces sp. UNOB3_S3 TaxID=2871682 RepID=UPI001E33D8CE|nr:phosphotransferase [Streptomyces sp. UNOB3_S3]MCC3776809.1 aminoglycoside phosphotransferase family protein [Streptomyces sp. UNOB3_S3]